MRNFILIFLGCGLFLSGLGLIFLALSLLGGQQDHETRVLGEGSNYSGEQTEVTDLKDARIKAVLQINFEKVPDEHIRYTDYPFNYQTDIKIETGDGDLLLNRKSFIDWRDNSQNFGVRSRESSFVVQDTDIDGDSLNMRITVFFSRFRVPADGLINISIKIKANGPQKGELVTSTFLLDHGLSTFRIDNLIYGVLFAIVGCILLTVGAASSVLGREGKEVAVSGDSLDSRMVRRNVAICHASALCGYLIPFAGVLAVFLSWKKNRKNDYANAKGLDCLNFQLSTLIYLSLSFALSLFLIGFIMMLAVLLLHLSLTAKAILVTLRGGDWQYPLVFRFLP